MRTTLRIDAVTKTFDGTTALDEASLAVAAGEIVALLGPSGCGKTTLLRTIAGFERPEAGTVTIGSTIVAGGGHFVPPERRRIGMVFQDYALFPHLTIAENIGFGLDRRERAQRVAFMLVLVDLCGLGDRYPHQLSGGQQQRVALARALAPAPSAILLDEPWSNIDAHLRGPMRDQVIALLRQVDVTTVLVTHDREEAFAVADRIALMRDGRIVQVGTPEELYYAPCDRWAAEFVGATNLLAGEVCGGEVRTPLGTFPTADAVNGAVTALVRPELLELRVDDRGTAEVVAREFRGHDVFYRVRVGADEFISQRPSNEVVPLGARVAIHLHGGVVPVFIDRQPQPVV